jgi:hypothetical protein
MACGEAHGFHVRCLFLVLFLVKSDALGGAALSVDGPTPFKLGREG